VTVTLKSKISPGLYAKPLAFFHIRDGKVADSYTIADMHGMMHEQEGLERSLASEADMPRTTSV
jgi:hypothetical protein